MSRARSIGADRDQRIIGDGYGIPTAECLEAIKLLAQSEAVLLDPCYTGQGMAGLMHDLRAGGDPGARTGGLSSHRLSAVRQADWAAQV